MSSSAFRPKTLGKPARLALAALSVVAIWLSASGMAALLCHS